MKSKIDLKNYQVFAIAAVALLILASFTITVQAPDGEEFGDEGDAEYPAPDFQSAKDSIAQLVSTGINVDHLSEEELAALLTKVEYSNELTSLLQQYTDENIQIYTISIIQYGEEIMIMNIFMPDVYDIWCILLQLEAWFYYAFADSFMILCLQGDDVSCVLAAFCYSVALYIENVLMEEYGCYDGLSESVIASIQNISETLYNSGMVEISEICAVLDLM